MGDVEFFQDQFMIFRLAFLLCFFLSWSAKSQFTYVIDQTIPVEVQGKLLNAPWAGGLNSAQFNTMDLNGDGNRDLVVFDRTSNKISTFLNQSNEYRYHPEYEILFPAEISKWMIIRDYNCDGKDDIFIPSSNGIAVYKNITAPGQNLSWEKLRFFRASTGGYSDILLTQGFSQTNIALGASDIPSITDMDGDGDLDIISMRFVSPGVAEYHKNLSMENYGICDSLSYSRISQRWGDWEECNCGVFAFGESCSASGGKTNHSVGKAVLALDANGDGSKDLLFAEEDCPVLYLLPNEGTTENADMNAAQNFPAVNPIVMPRFPVAYFEDVDFDGVPDLVASPAVFARTNLNIPFVRSAWFYKNIGSKEVPNFTFIKDNFLQDEMIEVGDYAYPAFVDYDGDGDQDMFIGNYANPQFRGIISFYENVGSPTNTSFRLVTDDFLGLSQLFQFNVKPQFADINGDGNVDLTFVASDLNVFGTNLLYIPGSSPNALNFQGNQVLTTNFSLATTENLSLVDIDQDGRLDILLGKTSGALEYWRDAGPTGSFNYTLEDPAFMGFGQSLTRSNLTTSVADMDNDGRQDLIIGDKNGTVSIYGDFRGTMNAPQAATNIIFDQFSETYTEKVLGGRIKPVAVNLFNSDKPAIAVGTISGGVIILRNDGGQQLPAEPQITIYPNPIPSGVLSVRSDRNVLMQLFTIMGQKLTEPAFVGGNQPFSMSVHGFAPGIYVARFTFAGKSYSRKFIIL
ncbi:MAG: T9SS type A sorting domain-containing protein [Cyclobacteriaceae bacterium]